MVGIYYPMNKQEYIKQLSTEKNPYWLRYREVSLNALARATQDYGKDNDLPPCLFRSLLNVKLDVIMDGELSQDFY